jgi:hypothetical protein
MAVESSIDATCGGGCGTVGDGEAVGSSAGGCVTIAMAVAVEDEDSDGEGDAEIDDDGVDAASDGGVDGADEAFWIISSSTPRIARRFSETRSSLAETRLTPSDTHPMASFIMVKSSMAIGGGGAWTGGGAETAEGWVGIAAAQGKEIGTEYQMLWTLD